MKTMGLGRILGWSFLAIILALVILRTVAQPYRLSGDCMEPAFKDGGLYFLNRVSHYFRKYKIDDVVLFKYDEKIWISRIVALENDTIQIKEGNVMVNGVILQEVGVHRNWTNWKYGTYGVEQPIIVPSDHVYVLSDNLSAHHDDSRVFGPISTLSILGVIW